ncbi:uncharacterized protein KY384_008104 [Bacidia gigantensis]|uniref:uncharacterized protein n=1 Tax=Bacidia gigantensis TaxID=2732470 RepID=UPI001D055A02|nr:uncharacterized protein KY384_008104 [Bacidia gigantensis]KAG8526675.1 hypothetical protein KY384_008104 [Bacidia gigantensis]
MDGVVHKTGLTVVYEPKKARDHSVDIVFVHGILGHPKDTWTCSPKDSKAISEPNDSDENDPDLDHPPSKRRRIEPAIQSNEVFWPRDLLPEALPQARVMTWGYDVSLKNMLSPKSKDSVFHHAGVLLSDLALRRSSDSAKRRPLIFIAHSLGGVVVKDALSRSRNEATWIDEILPTTLGVMFLGTPHHGSKAAGLGKIAMNLIRTFYWNANDKILSAITENSETLDRITRSFGQILGDGKVKVHSFQEELKTHGYMIVQEQASSIGYLGETKGYIHANHKEIAKFRDSTDRGFQSIIAVLGRWLESVNQAPDQPSTVVKSGIKSSKLPDGLIFDEVYNKECEDCLKSLNIAAARTRMENVTPAYYDTYKWLYDDMTGFTSWLSGKDERPIFWINGKPGSGKSTLMKYAMGHTKTKGFLEQYDSNSWNIAGYFFHDRGTEVQKSINGFLREILYQILQQQPDLFTFIYSIWTSVKRDTHNTERPEVRSWKPSHIKDAIRSIASKSTYPLNLCLFVDALDEHDGKHQELISTLRSLTQCEQNSYFRIRLCVAGRPENVFRTAFSDYPGFAIHDYTTSDIRHYAEDRIRKEQRGELTVEGTDELQSLVSDIMAKARGVFLWVRLVVNELIEGLTDGATFDQLERLLSEIPVELEDLYVRAMRRARLSTAMTLENSGYEVFAIFQIAISALGPFTMTDMLMAAHFLTTGKPAQPVFRKMSYDQMVRRLNALSGGLLEVFSHWRTSKPDMVQFIHQTVKEFVMVKAGEKMIKENVGEHVMESGRVLIFRSLLCSLAYGDIRHQQRHSSGTPAETDPGHKDIAFMSARYNLATSEFMQYALSLEICENVCVADFIEPLLQASPPSDTDDLLTRIIWTHLELKWIKTFREVSDQPDVQVLLFYTLLNLHLSLEQALRSRQSIIKEAGVAALLVKAAVFKEPAATSECNVTFNGQSQTLGNSAGPLEPSPQVLEVFLEQNVNACLTQTDVMYLNGIMRHRTLNQMDRILVPELSDLWEKLMYGNLTAGARVDEGEMEATTCATDQVGLVKGNGSEKGMAGKRTGRKRGRPRIKRE